MRLFTIPMSHYAEKARFALTRLGVPYEEERHAQGPHYLVSLRVARSPFLPVLRHAGRTVADSTAILRYLDSLGPEHERLFPSDLRHGDEVERLEDDFDLVLGPATRRLIYLHYLDDPARFLAIACQGVPGWERRFLERGWPLAARFASWRLRLRRDGIADDMNLVRATCDAISLRLADGRRYLLGDRFTAADLGFAAMLSPIVLPREYGVALPRPEELPGGLRELSHEIRATPAGAFALRLFAEERRRSSDSRRNPDT